MENKHKAEKPRSSLRLIHSCLEPKRWKWPSRVSAHIDFLMRQQVDKARPRLPDIMGIHELLARISMLARASPLDLMDDNGNMDVKNVKEAGLQYLVNGVKRRVTTLPNGTVTETIEYKVESRAKYLELLGRNLGLWKDDTEWPPRWLVQLEAEARTQLALDRAGEETTP